MGYSMISETPSGELLFSPEGFGSLAVKKMEMIKTILVAVLKDARIIGTADYAYNLYSNDGNWLDSPFQQSRTKLHLVVKDNPKITGKMGVDFQSQAELDNLNAIAKHIATIINATEFLSDISAGLLGFPQSVTTTMLNKYLRKADLQTAIDALNRYALDKELQQIAQRLTNNINTLTTRQNEIMNKLETARSNISTLQSGLENTNALVSTANTNITALQTGLTETNELIETIEANITEIRTLLNKHAEDLETIIASIDAILQYISEHECRIKANEENIQTLLQENNNRKNEITANTNEITANTNKITANKNQITANTNQITTNTNDIKTLFQYASDGKKLIATAITGKGVSASNSDTFSVLANKISQIQTGGGGKLKSKFYTQADSLYTIRGASGSGEFETIHKFNGKGIIVFTETGSMGQNCCEPDIFSGTEFRVVVDGNKEYDCVEEGDSIAFNTSLDIQCCTYSSTHNCWACNGDPIIAYWMGVITFLE